MLSTPQFIWQNSLLVNKGFVLSMCNDGEVGGDGEVQISGLRSLLRINLRHN